MEALIVGVSYYNMDYDLNESMKELVSLCEACEITVKYSMVQNLDRINPATYIGKGKVDEIHQLKDEVDVVIFNEELSPLQIKNLTDELEIEVKDRTDLILTIFESRANTPEAKLQVKIAKYEYLLPRLVGMNESMGHQQGGSGFRGSGEKQIELDRREIMTKLIQDKRELASLVKVRQTQRKRRNNQDEKVVALVGYTNSGKSSLMNYLLEKSNNDKKVFEKDMLFATLETSTRYIHVKNHKPFILSDTVGFISQLPHHLVNAFCSTLEEVVDADLIVMVIDSSSPQYLNHIEVTKEVLKQLGASSPILYVYNKIDLNRYAFVKPEDPYVFISVKEDKNMEEFLNQVNRMLYPDDRNVEFFFPYDKMRVVSYLMDHTNVVQLDYQEDGTLIKAQCSKKIIEEYKEYLVEEDQEIN